jgi:hypothetical protein
MAQGPVIASQNMNALNSLLRILKGLGEEPNCGRESQDAVLRRRGTYGIGGSSSALLRARMRFSPRSIP